MLKIFNRNFLYTTFFFVYPLIIALTFPVHFNDLGIWTALGMESIRTGHLVTIDTFSILPTVEMIYPSWGISLVYGAINLAASEHGIAWLNLFHKLVLLCFLLRVYFKYLSNLQNKWHFKNLVYILFFIYGGNILYTNRPSFVAMLPALFAFEIIHENFKLTKKEIAKLFLITVLWINIHASAMLVIVMLGWKIATSIVLKWWKKQELIDFRSFSVAAFATGSALFINPFGKNIFPYVIQTAQISRQRQFTEWLSPFYFDDVFHSVVFFVWIGFVIYKLYVELKKSRYEILTSPYFLLSLMGFFSIRDTVWTYYFMFAIMIEDGAKEELSSKFGHYLNVIIVTFFWVILICLNPFRRPTFLNSFNNARYNLEENIPEIETKMILGGTNQGPIFDVGVSGYLFLRRVPNKTFLDARNIIFSDSAFEEGETVSHAKDGWEDILKKYSFKYLLLDRQHVDPSLIEKIQTSKNWKVLSSRKFYFLAERVE